MERGGAKRGREAISEEQVRDGSRGATAQERPKSFADWRSIPLMIGLDTNVLVLFLVRDDEEQFERARKLIRRQAQDGQPVRISLLVLLETEWVLRSRYKLKKGEILSAFSDLLSVVDMSFEDEPSARVTSYCLQSICDRSDGLLR